MNIFRRFWPSTATPAAPGSGLVVPTPFTDLPEASRTAYLGNLENLRTSLSGYNPFSDDPNVSITWKVQDQYLTTDLFGTRPVLVPTLTRKGPQGDVTENHLGFIAFDPSLFLVSGKEKPASTLEEPPYRVYGFEGTKEVLKGKEKNSGNRAVLSAFLHDADKRVMDKVRQQDWSERKEELLDLMHFNIPAAQDANAEAKDVEGTGRKVVEIDTLKAPVLVTLDCGYRATTFTMNAFYQHRLSLPDTKFLHVANQHQVITAEDYQKFEKDFLVDLASAAARAKECAVILATQQLFSEILHPAHFNVNFVLRKGKFKRSSDQSAREDQQPTLDITDNSGKRLFSVIIGPATEDEAGNKGKNSTLAIELGEPGDKDNLYRLRYEVRETELILPEDYLETFQAASKGDLKKPNNFTTLPRLDPRAVSSTVILERAIRR